MGGDLNEEERFEKKKKKKKKCISVSWIFLIVNKKDMIKGS